MAQPAVVRDQHQRRECHAEGRQDDVEPERECHLAARKAKVRRERQHGEIPQAAMKGSSGCSRTSASPVEKAFGGHVIGSTATLLRLTSGSGSPLNTIT